VGNLDERKKNSIGKGPRKKKTQKCVERKIKGKQNFPRFQQNIVSSLQGRGSWMPRSVGWWPVDRKARDSGKFRKKKEKKNHTGKTKMEKR